MEWRDLRSGFRRILCGWASTSRLWFSLGVSFGFLGCSVLSSGLWSGFGSPWQDVDPRNLFKLFLLCFLAFKVWRLCRWSKQVDGILEPFKKPRIDFGSEFRPSTIACKACGVKILSWRGGVCENAKVKKEPMVENKTPHLSHGHVVGRVGREVLLPPEDEAEEENEGDGQEEEDGVVVAELKAVIGKERRHREAIELELEKERLASYSAIQEMMLKIRKLENEKGLLALDARHHREMDERMQQLYESEIEYLRWIISACKLQIEGSEG